MLRYHHQCVLRLPIGILGTEMICTMPRIQHTIAIFFQKWFGVRWIRVNQKLPVCAVCVCVRSCCVCLRTCVLRYYCVSTDYAVFFSSNIYWTHRETEIERENVCERREWGAKEETQKIVYNSDWQAAAPHSVRHIYFLFQQVCAIEAKAYVQKCELVFVAKRKMW